MLKLCLIFFQDCVLMHYDPDMEKIVESDELMKCIRGEPVIYVHSSKYFKIALKEKKCMEKNNLCTRDKYCISTR